MTPLPVDRFLTGKTAWVTGASRGVGRTIAIALAERGATVILGARDEQGLSAVAAVITSFGGTAHALPLDLATPWSIQEFASRAADLTGPPAILINNAGAGLFRDFVDMDLADLDRQIDVNLRGPAHLTQAAARHMKRSGDGVIINIGSIAGEVAFKRGAPYCAAKAGLHMLTEVLMLELREAGIRTCTIAPGSVQTGFHRTALPSANPRDDSWMLEPEDIANAVLHVLSAPAHAMISYYEVRPTQTAPR